MIKVMSYSCSYTLGPLLICTFEPYSHYTLVMSPSVFTLKISSLWLTLNVAVFSIQMSVKHYLKFLTFMCRFLLQCCHLIGWVDNGMFEKVCKCRISSVNPVSISKLKKTASRTSSTASVSVSITAICALCCRAEQQMATKVIIFILYHLKTFIFVLFYFKVIFIVPLMGSWGAKITLK